jgi:hypothetical protein
VVPWPAVAALLAGVLPPLPLRGRQRRAPAARAPAARPGQTGRPAAHGRPGRWRDLEAGWSPRELLRVKLAGLTVPLRWLAHPRAQRFATLVPVALLAALIAVQAVGHGQS